MCEEQRRLAHQQVMLNCWDCLSCWKVPLWRCHRTSPHNRCPKVAGCLSMKPIEHLMNLGGTRGCLYLEGVKADWQGGGRGGEQRSRGGRGQWLPGRLLLSAPPPRCPALAPRPPLSPILCSERDLGVDPLFYCCLIAMLPCLPKNTLLWVIHPLWPHYSLHWIKDSEERVFCMQAHYS